MRAQEQDRRSPCVRLKERFDNFKEGKARFRGYESTRNGARKPSRENREATAGGTSQKRHQNERNPKGAPFPKNPVRAARQDLTPPSLARHFTLLRLSHLRQLRQRHALMHSAIPLLYPFVSSAILKNFLLPRRTFLSNHCPTTLVECFARTTS